MDRDDPSREARRLLSCTAALAGTLVAPAVLQAAMILCPDTLAAQHAGFAMSLALAGVVIAVPRLLAALFANAGEPSRFVDAHAVDEHR